MKITPVAGPNSVQSTQGPTVSADRREAAKQAYLGQSVNREVPSDTQADPQVARAQESVRKIKMRTNFNTNRDDVLTESATIDAVVPEVAPPADPVPEVTAPISPQLAAIARQRRALQVKESEIAAREKALADQATGSLDIAKLKSNPLSVLQEHGVTYDQLTQAILADRDGVNPDIQALKAQVQALEKGLDTRLSERDSQAEQQVLSELQREAKALIGRDDTYEMIKTQRMEPKITELIHRTWKSTGEILDVSEAADLIETDLLNDAVKIAGLKKVQSKLTPIQAPPQVQQRQGIRTLTNRDTASAPLSARARALAAFNGTLRK